MQKVKAGDLKSITTSVRMREDARKVVTKRYGSVQKFFDKFITTLMLDNAERERLKVALAPFTKRFTEQELEDAITEIMNGGKEIVRDHNKRIKNR